MGKQTFAILSYTQTTAAWYVGRGERGRAHLQVNETTTEKKKRTGHKIYVKALNGKCFRLDSVKHDEDDAHND